MTLQWRGRSLWVLEFPVAAMGRLAGCAPADREEAEVLAALLAGAKVYAPWEGLEYRRYRKSAPLGVYRRCVALERELREMGVIVVRNSGGQPLGHEKIRAAGGTGLPDRAPER